MPSWRPAADWAARSCPGSEGLLADCTQSREHRNAVLLLVAFHGLLEQLTACDGARLAKTGACCDQNDGEGWMLLGALTLSAVSMGPGRDGRVSELQVARAVLGPRCLPRQQERTVSQCWPLCEGMAALMLPEQEWHRAGSGGLYVVEKDGFDLQEQLVSTK